jgi:tetratricopeptide (TPR) repeat protein
MLKKFLIFVALVGLFFFYLPEMLDYGVNKGMTDTPKKPGLTFFCARTMMMLGDYKKAVAAYEESLKAFPDHPDTPKTYSRIGHCYENLGKKNDDHCSEYYLKARHAYKTFMEKYKDHYWYEQIKYSNENLNAVLPADSR